MLPPLPDGSGEACRLYCSVLGPLQTVQRAEIWRVLVALQGCTRMHVGVDNLNEGFFDCGRVVRCTLPLGAGRFTHLVVLYGYQGADSDPEQLALTDQLFDAALGELSVVARGQPCMLVGDFNVELTKIPCLAKGISAGLWVDLEVSWALAAGLEPSPTCKRAWGSSGGTRRDFMVGCPLAADVVLSCTVQPEKVDCSSPCDPCSFWLWSVGVLGYEACSLYPSLACFLVVCC